LTLNYFIAGAQTIKRVFKGCELISVKEEKITSFTITSIQPELTNKQKRAVELAINNDYYEYPRKIELKKLAKLMNLSYSTYQAHLRKAEKKLIKFLYLKVR
jgi:predicted DNA binding protein